MFNEQVLNRICKLNVHSSVRDVPALRMGISQMLSSVDFRPTGMSPSAILLVDRIVEKIPSDVAGLQRNIAKTNRWASAFRGRLDDIYRTAIRPQNGQIKTNAKAILFSDQAELIACLCGDIIEGSVSDKWWWQRTYAPRFYAATLSSAIRSSLLETPRLIPVVFDLFAQWQQAVNLVKQLDSTDAEVLTSAVLTEFDCSSLANKLTNVRYPDKNANQQKDQQNLSAEAVHLNSHRLHSNRRLSPQKELYPPWFTLFSEQIWEQGLSKPQACLLGVARLAHSTPMLLRNVVFEDQITSWWVANESTELADQFVPERRELEKENSASINSGDELDSQTHDGEKITGLNRKIEKHAETETTGEIIRDNPQQNRKTATAVEASIYDADSEPNNRALVLEKGAETSDSTVVDIDPHNLYTTDKNASGDLSRKPSENLNNETTEAADEVNDNDNEFYDESWLTEKYIDTELAGCLYLINLLDQLELPNCMNATWAFDQHLSRWAFFELILRLLLGEQNKELVSDPLWKLLAMLDQRKLKSLIGEKYWPNSDPDYHLPVDWWDYICSQDASQRKQIYWAIHNKQLRIWSRSYILIDKYFASSDLSQESLKEMLQIYMSENEAYEIFEALFDESPLEFCSQITIQKITTPLLRWASLALPFLRLYLKNQLALTSIDTKELTETLLSFPGRIYFTSSHIDLVTDVNLTSLNIRRSGLDQDPGWLPLYGRVVLFHFSQV